MKRKALFAFAVMALGFSSLMMSCSKSNQDLINDYRSLMKEAVEADMSGDASKQTKVEGKLNDLLKEMEKREFTTEEQMEILEITGSALDQVGYSF